MNPPAGTADRPTAPGIGSAQVTSSLNRMTTLTARDLTAAHGDRQLFSGLDLVVTPVT